MSQTHDLHTRLHRSQPQVFKGAFDASGNCAASLPELPGVSSYVTANRCIADPRDQRVRIVVDGYPLFCGFPRSAHVECLLAEEIQRPLDQLRLDAGSSLPHRVYRNSNGALEVAIKIQRLFIMMHAGRGTYIRWCPDSFRPIYTTVRVDRKKSERTSVEFITSSSA